ncbi:MAG: NADH-quinone oxidoreductase subunit NuoE [bacterium]
MLPAEIGQSWKQRIAETAHPRELVVDLLFALQDHYGYLSDEALEEAAGLLALTPLEVEELATFYPFLYREPVGRYVIHLCDSLICWMGGSEALADHLFRRLGIRAGETTPDGLFTLLPVCCIGYCDRAPAMLINRKVYGELTPEKVDGILESLKQKA